MGAIQTTLLRIKEGIIAKLNRRSSLRFKKLTSKNFNRPKLQNSCISLTMNTTIKSLIKMQSTHFRASAMKISWMKSFNPHRMPSVRTQTSALCKWNFIPFRRKTLGKRCLLLSQVRSTTDLAAYIAVENIVKSTHNSLQGCKRKK